MCKDIYSQNNSTDTHHHGKITKWLSRVTKMYIDKNCMFIVKPYGIQCGS